MPFISSLKALFVLKIFKYLYWLFGHVEKQLLKDKVNFKIYGISNWLAITIHILPNISWSKNNQTMKLGQLIEYNQGNIFLQKSCKKWGRETVGYKILKMDSYLPKNMV